MPLNLHVPQSQEALHSLTYQKGPNLCTELEKVFDEVFAYKKSLGDAPTSEKSKMVINYVKNTAGKKILQVIKQYTGMTMELKLSKSLDFGYAVVWYFGDVLPKRVVDKEYVAIFLARLRYMGVISNAEFEKYVKRYKGAKTQKELEQISRELMHDKAAMKAAMHEKFKLNAKLYFDPYSAFLWTDLYPEGEDLTSKEIAAIVAHECGHVIAFLVHMTDLCYKKEILYTACKEYYERADEEAKKRYALSMAQKVLPEEVKKISEKIKNTKVKKDQALIGNIAYAAWYLILRSLLNARAIISSCVEEVFKLTILNLFTHAESYNPDKRSDFADGSMGNYMDEEMADEFVSKMGYAPYLSTGLRKAERFVRFYYHGTGGYTHVSRFSYYSNLLPFLALSFLYGYRRDYIHPDDYTRRENQVMNVIKAFKASNCPSELLDEYYKMYKLAKEINESRLFEEKWEIANSKIRDFVKYLIETPQSMLFEGRFQQEYETLFRSVQKLMNNQLYALSYGLNQKDTDK